MNPSTIAEGQYLATTDKLTARIVMHSYNTNPHSYSSWLKGKSRQQANVLEVGARTGELWKQLDHTPARLILTDFSPAMCTLDTTVKKCDAASPPFADDRFDLIITYSMLYHVEDPDAVLEEFARVLSPYGTLVAALSRRDHNAELKCPNCGCWTMFLKDARIVAEIRSLLGSPLFRC